MTTVIQVLVAILTVICIAILSIFLIAFIIGWIESKNKKADLSNADLLKLKKSYQKHVAAASRYKDEINKRLSSIPTMSDGGVGNYKQAVDKAVNERKPHIVTRKIEPDRSASIEVDRSAKIPERKPHIATRKVEIEELREWAKEAKAKEDERKNKS